MDRIPDIAAKNDGKVSGQQLQSRRTSLQSAASKSARSDAATIDYTSAINKMTDAADDVISRSRTGDEAAAWMTTGRQKPVKPMWKPGLPNLRRWSALSKRSLRRSALETPGISPTLRPSGRLQWAHTGTMPRNSRQRIGDGMSLPRMKRRPEDGVCGLTQIRSIRMSGGRVSDDRLRSQDKAAIDIGRCLSDRVYYT